MLQTVLTTSQAINAALIMGIFADVVALVVLGFAVRMFVCQRYANRSKVDEDMQTKQIPRPEQQ